MPTYDYVCDGCEHEFEIFQSMAARPLRKCPECSQSKLRRLIGAGGGVIFKGSGFYQTDYRSDSYKQGAEAEKPKSDKPDKADKSDTPAKKEASAGSTSDGDKGPTKPAKK
jgi:putative FmdB family regulatory protein